MPATWTRGQLWDKIVEQAQKNPKYYEMLKTDPRGLMEKQLGIGIPETVNIQVLEERPDTYYIVLPAFAKEGELSDTDLEKVAGGGGVKGDATCTGSGMSIGVTVVEVSGLSL